MTLSPRRVTAANGTIAAGLMLAALVLYLARVPATRFCPGSIACDSERRVGHASFCIVVLIRGKYWRRTPVGRASRCVLSKWRWRRGDSADGARESVA